MEDGSEAGKSLSRPEVKDTPLGVESNRVEGEEAVAEDSVYAGPRFVNHSGHIFGLGLSDAERCNSDEGPRRAAGKGVQRHGRCARPRIIAEHAG